MARAKEIQDIKEILLNMKKEMVENLKEKMKAADVSEHREIGDMFDDADLEQSREFELLLTSREKQKLEQIDAALKRMEAGEYGVCEECEEEIPIGRLKALPFATLCVKCKSRKESMEGHAPVVEEEMK